MNEIIINGDMEMQFFFKAFERAVLSECNSAATYRSSVGDIGFEQVRNCGHTIVHIMTTNEGVVYCGEVYCERGIILAKAVRYSYDIDSFARDEIAEIVSDILHCWNVCESIKDHIIVALAGKRELRGQFVGMIVGAIFDHSLNVSWDGRCCPNFTPQVLESMTDSQGCNVRIVIEVR